MIIHPQFSQLKWTFGGHMEIFLLKVIAGDGHSNGLPDVDGLRPVKEYTFPWENMGSSGTQTWLAGKSPN